MAGPSPWVFAEPSHQAVFTTKPVLHLKTPVLEVFHDRDGDWQFMCGTTTGTEDACVVSLGCMVELDHSLCELADLPIAWVAWREASDRPWVREPYELCDD